MRYAIVTSLPDTLERFQSKNPRQLADGSWILKWAEEEERPEIASTAQPNKYQTGIVYWFVEKRNWYTYSEILQRVAEEPILPPRK